MQILQEGQQQMKGHCTLQDETKCCSNTKSDNEKASISTKNNGQQQVDEHCNLYLDKTLQST
jgi:hypothetical protein